MIVPNTLPTSEVSIIDGPAQAVRELDLILVVDTSGSMSGTKIASVNAAVRNMIPDLQSLEDSTPGVKIFIQIIAFDDDARRIYPQPESVQTVNFVPLECGVTSNMGAGITMARDEIEALQNSGKHFKRPVFVFLSDGAVSNWQVPLKELLAIRLGRASQRIAFAVGNGADKNMLENVISDDQDGVFEVHDAGQLTKMLSLVSVSASAQASRGHSSELGDHGGGFQVPELNSSLIPQDAQMSSKDVAKKVGIDSESIF